MGNVRRVERPPLRTLRDLARQWVACDLRLEDVDFRRTPAYVRTVGVDGARVGFA